MRELTLSSPSPRAQLAAERLVALAEKQRGPLHRRQLEAAGVSSSTISRWVATRRLHRLYPEVYVLGHRALCDAGQLRAALLYVGEDAVLSHSTAAWWWGLVNPDPPTIHISTAEGRASIDSVVVHQPRELERARYRGLPLTTVPRTLLDVAATAPFDKLRRVLADAEFRGLLRMEALDTVLRRGRPGSAALRRARDMHQPALARTLSKLEEKFVELCERHAIPTPEVNAKICGLMVDAVWRPERVAVELDGRAAHESPAAIERDRRRDLTLRAGGYLVLRYTWGQVTTQDDLVAADVHAALRRELPPVTPGVRG
jgi:very-short-patch-repair endonuclease